MTDTTKTGAKTPAKAKTTKTSEFGLREAAEMIVEAIQSGAPVLGSSIDSELVVDEKDFELNRLTEVASHMFTSIANRPGMKPDSNAKYAFELAKVFCDEERRIRDGGEIGDVTVPMKAPWVVVEVYNPVNQRPELDDNGEVRTQKVHGDLDAFAPNLSPTNPFNQKFIQANRIRNSLNRIPAIFDDAVQATEKIEQPKEAAAANN